MELAVIVVLLAVPWLAIGYMLRARKKGLAAVTGATQGTERLATITPVHQPADPSSGGAEAIGSLRESTLWLATNHDSLTAESSGVTTEGNRERLIEMNGQPTRILIEPTGDIIGKDSLPYSVVTEKGLIEVRKFTPDGVVLDEHNVVGQRLRITVLEGGRRKASPDTSVVMNGFEFYPGRGSLPEHRQLRALLASARKEVWAMWNTGAFAARGQLLGTPIIKRILLPHPDNVAPILAAAEAEHADRATIASQIEKLTALAFEVADKENVVVEVRWLTTAPRNTVILGDPLGTNAWAFVEWFQPGVPEDQRPSVWFTRERFSVLWDFLRDMYLMQWETKSVNPVWRPSVDVSEHQICFNLSARQPITTSVRLVLTKPDGATLEQTRMPPYVLPPWLGYPQHFQGEGPAQSGRYVARWEIPTPVGWREAITVTYEICVPGHHSW